MYFESKIYKLLNEQDDDKYSHIGYGKYKEKGKEDDESAPVFTKNDAGKYVPAKDDGKEKADDEPKKVAKILEQKGFDTSIRAHKESRIIDPKLVPYRFFYERNYFSFKISAIKKSS